MVIFFFDFRGDEIGFFLDLSVSKYVADLTVFVVS